MHRGKGLWSSRQVFTHASKLYSGSDITVIRPGILKIPNLDYASILFSRRKESIRQIHEFKPDLIVGFQILSPFIAAILAKRAGIPFIYYWTDVYHEQIPFKAYRPLGKLIEKKTIQKSTMVFSINEKLTDYVIRLGANPSKTKTLGGTVDTKRFSSNIDPKKIRNTYGLNKSDFVLCFVGLFHDRLALDEVLAGLAKINDPSVKLLLVGEGDQHAPNKVEELSALARNLGINDRVILTGRRSYQEIPGLISAGDVCILPARLDEMMQHIVPIKMYEYMAMRKPVITTKLPGVMKEFGDNNGVIYVDGPQDIIPKAVELSANGLTGLGLKARSFVEKHGWDKISDEFEKTLKGLIDKGK